MCSVIFLISCGKSSLQSAIVGKWERLDEQGQVLTKPVTKPTYEVKYRDANGKPNNWVESITFYPGTIEFQSDGKYTMSSKTEKGSYTTSGSYEVLSGSTISMTSIDISNFDSTTSLPKSETKRHTYNVNISGNKLTMQLESGKDSTVYQKMQN